MHAEIIIPVDRLTLCKDISRNFSSFRIHCSTGNTGEECVRWHGRYIEVELEAIKKDVDFSTSIKLDMSQNRSGFIQVGTYISA